MYLLNIHLDDVKKTKYQKRNNKPSIYIESDLESVKVVLGNDRPKSVRDVAVKNDEYNGEYSE